jgi:hypothetical protein
MRRHRRRRCEAGRRGCGSVQVASRSHRLKGSIALLVRLFSFWQGELFVLVRLGLAATNS